MAMVASIRTGKPNRRNGLHKTGEVRVMDAYAAARSSRALLIGCLGALSLYHGVLRSLMFGRINIGASSKAAYFVTFNHNPSLFVLAVLLFLLAGMAWMSVAWRYWRMGLN